MLFPFLTTLFLLSLSISVGSLVLLLCVFDVVHNLIENYLYWFDYCFVVGAAADIVVVIFWSTATNSKHWKYQKSQNITIPQSPILPTCLLFAHAFSARVPRRHISSFDLCWETFNLILNMEYYWRLECDSMTTCDIDSDRF